MTVTGSQPTEVATLERAAIAKVIRAELRRSNWNPDSIADAILAEPLRFTSAIRPLSASDYDGHDVYNDNSLWAAVPAAIGPIDAIAHALGNRINSQLPVGQHITLTATPKAHTGSQAFRSLLRRMAPKR
ncbi:hypothetical protein [Rhodococcoides kyotonense]|uniref:Uncharacterized protein n=1 Tax=Rhodococcoides kyotonense TaxID=398843 RepID=A0A239FR17_9NOCA|nr:hypothetical protein [Rhodococcus kyotonensis]SNS59205.1 hypothetical protein SAMN05421642_103413 [Rhodococcus kyotonensis]